MDATGCTDRRRAVDTRASCWLPRSPAQTVQREGSRTYGGADDDGGPIYIYKFLFGFFFCRAYYHSVSSLLYLVALSPRAIRTYSEIIIHRVPLPPTSRTPAKQRLITKLIRCRYRSSRPEELSSCKFHRETVHFTRVFSAPFYRPHRLCKQHIKNARRTRVAVDLVLVIRIQATPIRIRHPPIVHTFTYRRQKSLSEARTQKTRNL